MHKGHAFFIWFGWYSIHLDIACYKKVGGGVLMLITMLLGTTNYLILAIFQHRLNVRWIGFVNKICKDA